jgi:hypothetical protein
MICLGEVSVGDSEDRQDSGNSKDCQDSVELEDSASRSSMVLRLCWMSLQMSPTGTGAGLVFGDKTIMQGNALWVCSMHAMLVSPPSPSLDRIG